MMVRQTDGQTAFQLYIVLASVPALSCRQECVAYNCAFGAPITLKKCKVKKILHAGFEPWISGVRVLRVND